MDSRLYSQSLTNSQELNASSTGASLEQVELMVQELALSCKGDCLALLSLLRLLEHLHRTIRDDLFQPALPSNRQHLYQLLRTIETEGGWPYIHRMKLQTLLEPWLAAEAPDMMLASSQRSEPQVAPDRASDQLDDPMDSDDTEK